jgi:hypothetical protein
MAFATSDQMADRSQGAITATTHQFLVDELAAATRAIRNECGWHIAPRETVVYRHVRPWVEQVWLPAMEIVSIDEVVIDGVTATDLTVYKFDPATGWTNISGCDVKVTYTAGFETVPEDIVALTLELSAGALGSPLGVSREQAGGVSVTLTRTSGGLMPDDLDRLAAYRIGRLP